MSNDRVTGTNVKQRYLRRTMQFLHTSKVDAAVLGIVRVRTRGGGKPLNKLIPLKERH